MSRATRRWVFETDCVHAEGEDIRAMVDTDRGAPCYFIRWSGIEHVFTEEN